MIEGGGNAGLGSIDGRSRCLADALGRQKGKDWKGWTEGGAAETVRKADRPTSIPCGGSRRRGIEAHCGDSGWVARGIRKIRYDQNQQQGRCAPHQDLPDVVSRGARGLTHQGLQAVIIGKRSPAVNSSLECLSSFVPKPSEREGTTVGSAGLHANQVGEFPTDGPFRGPWTRLLVRT